MEGDHAPIVSAFTTRKLPSFKPTAKASASGEKAQYLPPTKEFTNSTAASVTLLPIK